MRIDQDKSLQHIDRWLLKLGYGDIPIAVLPDSIRIPPENPYEIQEDSDIASRESLRQSMENVFPDINANVHTPEQQWISWIAERAMLTPSNSSVDQINAIISQEQLLGEATILCSADSTSDP